MTIDRASAGWHTVTVQAVRPDPSGPQCRADAHFESRHRRRRRRRRPGDWEELSPELAALRRLPAADAARPAALDRSPGRAGAGSALRP
jgi:hypothetical protein